MEKAYDFIFGAQYYRAPTPAPENWESDLKLMKKLGFDSVKFWVQWRWSHRGEDTFYFEDTDRLMDLAYKYGLKVTINVIFDVVPQWILKKYPDSKIVLANGHIVEPCAVSSRQIGGFPGICYNHPEARRERMKFLQKTAEHYKNHPALYMWDVWNEPEQCGTFQKPKDGETSCYCPNCKKAFTGWLKEKYETIDRLNDVWGRCYADFDEVELPQNKNCFSDFIDFHTYHNTKMAREAKERMDTVRSVDKLHAVYFHVVPETFSGFNPVTGVNDFEMAKLCGDVFASTTFSRPCASVLTLSAADGRLCYNVESHIGNGSIKMHEKQISLRDVANDFVPQIGMGIRGFLFWQFRPETLGSESPAWGVATLDGRCGSLGYAAEEFNRKLTPIKADLMKIKPKKPEIAIWKDTKNVLFSYCAHDSLEHIASSIETYINGFYYNNFNCSLADDVMIQDGLQGTKLLVMPCCYALSRKTADAIDSFVRNGGSVLCEAHLGGFDLDKGRHSYKMPGQGLDEKWGILEEYTTSSFHLHLEKDGELDMRGFNEDMKKALLSYGTEGGKYFGIALKDGSVISGAERFACLKADGAEVLGTFNGAVCIIKKKIGRGTVYYVGTDIGVGAEKDRDAFERFITFVARDVGVLQNPYSAHRGVHADELSDSIVTVTNVSETDADLHLKDGFKGLFFGTAVTDGKVTVPAKTSEIFVKG